MRTRIFSKECFYNALKDLCRKYPYEEIRISQICMAAGFNRSTFYRNYHTKEDILKDKVTSLMTDYYEHCKENHFSTYQSLAYLFFFYRKNGDAITLMHKAHMDDLLLELSLQNFPDLASHRDKYEKSFIAGGYLSILLHWLDNGMQEADDVMALNVLRLVEKLKVGSS